MGKFNIYPKKGEMFTLECYKFEYDENSFRLYDDGNSQSKEGFLSFEHVAAILPEKQSQPRNPIHFQVYLKGRKEPLEVIADAFDLEHPPSVRFYAKDVFINSTPTDLEIQHLYISTSEVVAIIPSDGLKSYRH